ncbi:MAG: helix-turn-helix domain-containing protein [Clostridiales bacterium]|jgi:hypothetical protein|nr:helix-turn-helix domain-containing protein [Clostridiales bacterium]
MEGYMTTKEAAEKWVVSVRQVQNYCKKDIIPGVKKVGTNYLIPDDASRPRYGFFSEADSNKIKE